MDYLLWYRSVLGIPVHNSTKVKRGACFTRLPVVYPFARSHQVPAMQPLCTAFSHVYLPRPALTTASHLPQTHFVGLQVRLIEPLQPSSPSDGFKITVQRTGAADPELLYARKVVLATGIQGGGEW